ncbi:MAG: adenine deaminase C-terminal domain-containing protein [Ruthenibacterium sp.]
MALPVIPELRLTDEGLFDVVAFCRVTDERQGGLKP